MLDFQALSGPLFVFISLCVAASAILRRTREGAGRRARELEAAAEALRAHYDAVEHVIDDPALSDAAKDLLYFASEMASNEELAEQFMKDALGSAAPKGWKSPIVSELRDLEKTRPDLTDNYAVAIGAALVVIGLRWPKNAVLFAKLMARISADRHKEILAVEQSRRNVITRNDNGPDSGLGYPITAAFAH